jgi:hypothetical protein
MPYGLIGTEFPQFLTPIAEILNADPQPERTNDFETKPAFVARYPPGASCLRRPPDV